MRRGSRIAIAASLTLAVAFATLAVAFLVGVTVPGEFLRAPLERALTVAFGVPARIEGPLRVRTGLSATATADALVLADLSAPQGVTLARATKPAAQFDLVALLRRAVALAEVTGERLELNLRRAADGRANWAPLFAASPHSGPPPFTFGGIARLRIGRIAGSYRSEGSDPVRFAIAAFDGGLPLRDPATARGTAQVAGYTIAFDLRTASLAGPQAAGAAIPLQGTLGWAGARLALDGEVAPDAARYDAAAELTAADADELLAALGVAARDAGRLEARGRIGVTATEVAASELKLALGASDASGSASVAWGAPRLRVAIDAVGERIDLEPFLAAESPARGETPAEAFVAFLERAAAGIDADLKVAVAELAGLPLAPHEVRLECRSSAAAIAVHGHSVLSGTRAKLALDYDARKPLRVLTATVEGGAVSTAGLPAGERARELSGSTTGIRGQVRGQGATPRELVASLQGSLDARDLRWTLAQRDAQPVRGRFDTVRIAVRGTRTSSAEIRGRLGDAACTLKASGGALAPLLAGSQWPVQLAGSCTGGRLSAKGRIALAERHVAADLAFDAAANRIGPVAQALGIAPDAPHPFAARGTLVLDEKLARVQLGALRLGRSAGSGLVEVLLDGAQAPRVQLKLTSADVDELAALFPGSGAAAPEDPLMRVVLPANRRLPDLEFDVAADTVRLAGETLRRVHAKGVSRDGHLPRTPLGFAWGGAQGSANLAADFRGASPRVELDGTAENADLGALAARYGQKGVRLRAGMLTLRARAAGARLGELLASATLDAALERGRLDLAQRPRGLQGPAEFSATLKATPGQPAALGARGTMGGEPFDLALDTPGLAGLARPGEAIPAALRLTLGDARFQAAGKLARDATGEGRVQLSGGRIDRLGKLLGVELPEVGPYSASATVVVSADAVRASDLDFGFGKSRVLGRADLQVKGAGRPLYSAALRAPALHLEDIGAARWLGGPAAGSAGEAPAAQRTEAEIARALKLLRATDLDAALEIDALHGGAERFASGRLRATLKTGVLRLLLQDVRTASGTVDADLRIDASGAQPRFGLHARIDDLDFGPLARTLDPATKLGGRLDLVADLSAQGPPGRLLPALAGTIDVAAFPHDLSSGALAFWGTGLLSTMLRTLDPNARSEVECAVASLDVRSGVASTDAFFVDTTRVRIIGQIDADLTTRALSGRLRPVSKQPELFTVAPTMVLGGTIESPAVTVAPESVVLTPLRFATPLAAFALDWLGARGQSREGWVGCREAFERARQARSGAARQSPR